MPKIIEYQQQVSSPGPIEVRRATAEDFGGDGGLRQLGKDISDAGATFYKIAERDDVFEAQKLASKEATDLERWIEDEKLKAPLGAEGFTEKISSELEKRKDALHSSYKASTSTGRMALESSLNGLYQRAQQESIQFEARSKAVRQTEDLKTQVNENSNIVRANPAKLPEMLERQEALFESMHRIPVEAKAELTNKARRGLFDSALDGTVTGLETSRGTTIGQIDALIKELKDDKSVYKKNSSEGEYDRNLTRLQNHRERVSYQNSQLLKTNFNEEMVQMQVKGKDFGKFSKSWINSNITDPVERQEWMRKREDSEQVMKQTAFVRVSSDEQILRKLSELNPATSTEHSQKFGQDMKAYNALREAYSFRQTAQKKDPAGYAREVDDAAKNAYDVYRTNRNPETAAHYADMAIAAQKKMDPYQVPSLLSSEEVANFKALTDRAAIDPKGAQVVTDNLQDMQKIWGKNWPIVVRDLKKGQAISDELYTAASMLDDPKNRGFADDLVRASTFNVKELVGANSEEGVKKAASEAAAEALKDFKKTFRTADGLRTYGAFENSLTKMLLYKSALNPGDMDDKAREYAGQMVNGKYSYGDTFRIPVVSKNNIPLNPSHVENGADLVLRSLKPTDIVPVRNSSDLTYLDAQEIYARRVKSKGFWVTDAEEAGLKLVDEKGSPVMKNIRGVVSPVRLSFEELQDLAREKQNSQREIEQENSLGNYNP